MSASVTTVAGPAPAVVVAAPAKGPARRGARGRYAGVVLPAALLVALLLAVPGLQPVFGQIDHMDLGWLGVAVALELASCVSFVLVFRLFYDRLDRRDATTLAWTSMASGALLPAGGVGGAAIGAWLMHVIGAPRAWIVRKTAGLFILTSATSIAAVIGAAAIMLAGADSPRDAVLAAGTLGIGVAAMAAVLVLPRLAVATRRRPSLQQLANGARDVPAALRRPSWRLLGAAGYLGFDIAVLGAAFAAMGQSVPAVALVLGYSVGLLANSLPVPGGIGVVDAGLAGALLLYDVPAGHVAAAVLVYHAIAFWLPGVGGVLAYISLRPRLLRAAPDADRSRCGGRIRTTPASAPVRRPADAPTP
jgi:uncharacterized membrane protein YbhN (UPF0104 family)